MLESVKSYVEGLQNMDTWLEVDAFKHKNGKTHQIRQFLQDVRRPVKPTEGLWNLWYNPVPNAKRAKDSVRKNVPPDDDPHEELDIQVGAGDCRCPRCRACPGTVFCPSNFPKRNAHSA